MSARPSQGDRSPAQRARGTTRTTPGMTGSRFSLAASRLAATLTLWSAHVPRPITASSRALSRRRHPKVQEKPQHAREEARRMRAQATPTAAPANGSEILDT